MSGRNKVDRDFPIAISHMKYRAATARFTLPNSETFAALPSLVDRIRQQALQMPGHEIRHGGRPAEIPALVVGVQLLR